MGSLTQLQKSVIIGSILGDGYLRQMPNRKDAFLEINHSIAAKDYVDWKYSILKNISKSPPKSRKGKGTRISYRFFTRQHPEISEFYLKFYENRKKRISDNLKLDPIILAVWFMDDGSKCRKSDVYLNTQQFSKDDQNRLIAALANLGLKATINKDKKYYRLRFLKESIEPFNRLIGNYIAPSMRYKLSYDPVETCSDIEQSSS